MLLRVSLLVALISVVRGNILHEQPQESTREGKGWDWIVDKLKGGGGAGEDYEGGDVTITGDTGDFFNPRERTGPVTRQDMTEEVIYKATVPIAADIVQIWVNISSINIMGPTEGDCGNSSLVITGTNPGPEIPVLCGVVTDQILYLDVDNVDGPVVFTMTLSVNTSIEQTFYISIKKLRDADSVQRRCLQVPTGTAGTIESFNYMMDPPGMMLNEQTYSICFGYVVGYCQIAFTFERLDLGPINGDCTNGKYLLIGDDKHCADKADYSIIANATGPINVGVRSGSYNDMEEEGFSATYTLIGC